ncbi:MAG: NADH-quinone oxidoreductase subunit NuoH, partial [Desulfovibrio sp.]|nr:NADH-quinone oxidoreductase subunit NuoH [Desulfovibrio sp.]
MNAIPAELLRIIIGLVAVAASVGLIGLVMVWVERKVAGHVQRRPGPFEVGPSGVLQPLCDALKLVGKQLFMPTGADPILFWLAPVLAFLPVLLLFLPLPVGEGLQALDVNLGLLLILAFSGLAVLSVLLAGWASNNKYGLLGAARGVAQSVAYEIPLLLAVLAVSFQAGSLNLAEVVKGQGTWPWSWNIMTQPLAFLIYIVSALGETNRAPFDLPEAESELTAGFHTEYSGMGFGLFFLAEYANMVVVCSVATALFLGGWQGPVLPGPVWFVLKVSALMLLMVFVRWTYPRVRFDQLLN